MKTKAWWVVIALTCAAPMLLAQTSRETATVKSKLVNVRAQPSIFSEVITQLKEGDKVTILEEIGVEKPKPEDVAKWYRVQMPANTPVWVNGSFVNTNATVKARRLNMRAGAGENFSVVGMLEQGDSIKEIRRKENWIEIEPPEKAYAFVAADLVEKQSDGPAPKSVKNSEPTPAAKAPEPVIIEPPQPMPSVQKTPTPAASNKLETIQPPAPKVTNEVAALPAPAMVNTNPPPVLATPPVLDRAPANAPLPATAAPAPKKKVVESLPKRIVAREGIVRGTISIQAPTDFQLESPYNGVVINYLFPTSTNLVLKNFRGKRVVVSGEEALDERWPSTPVLKVDSLQPAPSRRE